MIKLLRNNKFNHLKTWDFGDKVELMTICYYHDNHLSQKLKWLKKDEFNYSYLTRKKIKLLKTLCL